MNGYELSRRWFDFAFENPELISPNHVAIYFFAIEHCNRLGWKNKFGFPTQMAMDALGIKKYQTYIKYFNDLIKWNFFDLIQKSQNQYSANIISLTCDLPKNSKALDKAIITYGAKQTEPMGQSSGQSNSPIDKQQTTNNKQINNKQINNIVNDFDFYLTNKIAEFFKITELGNARNYFRISALVRSHLHATKLERQFDAYKAYKKESGEIVHSINGYLGSMDDFSDGAWCACDWIEKANSLEKKEVQNGIPKEPDNFWIKTKGQDVELYQAACKVWRLNGFENVQLEGSTVRVWRKKEL